MENNNEELNESIEQLKKVEDSSEDVKVTNSPIYPSTFLTGNFQSFVVTKYKHEND